MPLFAGSLLSHRRSSPLAGHFQGSCHFLFLFSFSYIGLLLFRCGWNSSLEKNQKSVFQLGKIHKWFVSAWRNSYPSWSGLVKCTETSQCLPRLCAAKGGLHSDLLKIKTVMLMTNFNHWQASVTALPYPHGHSVDTACPGMSFIAVSDW